MQTTFLSSRSATKRSAVRPGPHHLRSRSSEPASKRLTRKRRKCRRHESRFTRKAAGDFREEAHTETVDSSRTRDSRVIDFEWDEENREHIARHGLRVEDVEFALQHRTLDLGLQDWQEEERFSEVGMTASGRVIEVVTTWRGNKVRVVTAYDATKRKRILFSRDR